MPAKAQRPSWLQPGMVTLTARTGTPIYLRATAIVGFAGGDNDGAIVWVAGLEGDAQVLETASEVGHAITVATA